jgi:methyl-accepting chemotaxis protein
VWKKIKGYLIAFAAGIAAALLFIFKRSSNNGATVGSIRDDIDSATDGLDEIQESARRIDKRVDKSKVAVDDSIERLGGLTEGLRETKDGLDDSIEQSGDALTIVRELRKRYEQADSDT